MKDYQSLVDITLNKLKLSIEFLEITKDLKNKANEEIFEDVDAKLDERQEIIQTIQLLDSEFLTLFEKLKQDVTKIKAVREVVSSKLPAKSLESRLYDVARNVNFLLDGIMSIRFDTTDGVEIICTINSEERLANFLSNGEKSLLSLALLVVIKKIINWDIISIDEGSAALDENNKDRYLQMISSYTEGIDTIKQKFIVSHDYLVTDGEDLKIIKL